MKELVKLQCLHSRVLVNVGDIKPTDRLLPLLTGVVVAANETDIADISAAARFATGDSEAFVEGTTLLGEATRGENKATRGENVANRLTLSTL